MRLICVRTKAEYFCAKGWTGFWVICPSGRYNILRSSFPGAQLRTGGLALRAPRNDGESYARFADTMPDAAIAAITSEISTL